MKKVNTCGIPEELWVDGKCSECGYPDGINIRQENGCIDAEFCDTALQGACFERTSYRVSEFER